MSRSFPASVAIAVLAASVAGFAASQRFEKVSEHFYILQLDGDGANVGAMIGEDGILLVNPPAEQRIYEVREALNRLSSRPVRWIVHTDYSHDRGEAGDSFAADTAVTLASEQMQQLLSAAGAAERADEGAPREDSEARFRPRRAGAAPRFVFGSQVHLYPEDAEVRVIALRHKAHTAGDVVVFVPAEKVLMVGDLHVPQGFPEIDRDGGEGSAAGWFEGMKQVIDAVPLLKSAMPPPKPDPTQPPPEEKTLEELIVVIPGQGPVSNLQEMKDMLDIARRLRTEVGRAVRAGRGRERFLSSSLGAYRGYANAESFAGQLYDELMEASGR